MPGQFFEEPPFEGNVQPYVPHPDGNVAADLGIGPNALQVINRLVQGRKPVSTEELRENHLAKVAKAGYDIDKIEGDI